MRNTFTMDFASIAIIVTIVPLILAQTDECEIDGGTCQYIQDCNGVILPKVSCGGAIDDRVCCIPELKQDECEKEGGTCQYIQDCSGVILPNVSCGDIITDRGCCIPEGCTLDGETYPDGSLTPADRCLRYRCFNGAWEYVKERNPCGECSSSGKTSIKMYVGHFLKGGLSRSYQFDGSAGPYSFTQHGLTLSSSFGVTTTFKYTDGDSKENSITNVLYTELGITVEFASHGPNRDAQILVNGEEIQIRHNGAMTSFNSSVGTVYVSNDSPSWPRPIRGGNINIVGSQGLAVSIFAYNGYAWFVNSYAMPSMDMVGHLYGLCDVFFFGSALAYTMQDGSLTTNKNEFIESWKIKPPFGVCGIGNGECGRGKCTNTTAIGRILPNCLSCKPETYCWVA